MTSSLALYLSYLLDSVAQYLALWLTVSYLSARTGNKLGLSCAKLSLAEVTCCTLVILPILAYLVTYLLTCFLASILGCLVACFLAGLLIYLLTWLFIWFLTWFLATCYLLLATCYLLVATCYLLLASCDLRLASCICFLLLATRYLLPFSWSFATYPGWVGGGVCYCTLRLTQPS